MAKNKVVFQGSPFSVTASAQTAHFWCGRREALVQINRMVRSLSVRSDSMLQVIWASFGAGKSHALRYLGNQLLSHSPGSVTVYVEMSESTRTFLDLYKLVASALPFDQLFSDRDALKAVGVSTSVFRMANLWCNGSDDDRDIARRWLTAQKIDLRELKRVSSVTGRIETERDALEALRSFSSICRSRGGHLALLIDEFQRIGSISEKARSSILAGVRTLFNQNPTGLAIVLAVTSSIEQTALSILPNELRTILGPKPSLSLPELSCDEALDFCMERLAAYRAKDYEGDAAFPFGRVGLLAMIEYIAAKTNARMTPRNLIQAMAWIHDELEISDSVEPNRETIQSILSQLSWD